MKNIRLATIMLMVVAVGAFAAERVALLRFASVCRITRMKNMPGKGQETIACRWGQLFIIGPKEIQYGKDAKIWFGYEDEQAQEWDWNATGTRHVPGIQPADLDEFIDQVDEVILTRGVESALQVPQETIDYVKSKGKVCHVGETPDMIELYNTLVIGEGKKVGGVFHSTC